MAVVGGVVDVESVCGKDGNKGDGGGAASPRKSQYGGSWLGSVRQAVK